MMRPEAIKPEKKRGVDPTTWSADRNRLARAFASCLDITEAEQAAEGFGMSGGQPPDGWRIIGQGIHFVTLVKQGAMQSHAPGIVVKIPQGPFADERSFAQWARRIKQIQNAPPCLMPPMTIVSLRKKPSLVVMPYGPEDAKNVAPQWTPLEQAIASTQEQLAALDFVLDDFIQICCWNGIPFIFDWSDLVSNCRT